MYVWKMFTNCKNRGLSLGLSSLGSGREASSSAGLLAEKYLSSMACWAAGWATIEPQRSGNSGAPSECAYSLIFGLSRRIRSAFIWLSCSWHGSALSIDAAPRVHSRRSSSIPLDLLSNMYRVRILDIGNIHWTLGSQLLVGLREAACQRAWVRKHLAELVNKLLFAVNLADELAGQNNVTQRLVIVIAGLIDGLRAAAVQRPLAEDAGPRSAWLRETPGGLGDGLGARPRGDCAHRCRATAVNPLLFATRFGGSSH
ncbi:hypothetical protein DL89DRAFT_36776 [Linderina pennispora]|uniref:Uncharacterized protein n=1 Tax=Linderina pennispora TaxID=61395 RepID=A0A1Y1W2Y1_9FUNG|nr:uncharacterized protein DL89DRAFT_36776 [Linderina pennispora]ORX67807.1 hypothetical protein DL89DRAFT_36776 [Linderina pennispora]